MPPRRFPLPWPVAYAHAMRCEGSAHVPAPAFRRLGPDLLRSLVVPMTDFDEPKDPSWLLAFDWVELNKLQRAYKDGGDDALEGHVGN